MAWKKYFTPVSTTGKLGPVSGSISNGGSSNPSRTNYSSYLPDIYAGHPNRLERYGQYDTMDSDSEVNAAFDILAEFCTQQNAENGTPFQIFFKEQATTTEIKIIKKYLQQWCKLNKFNTRIFKIVRNALKYGDSFFVRDPETQAWMYVDPAKVDKIIVNESEGKKPEQYLIRDFNPNLETLATTAIQPSNVQGGGSQYGGSYGTGQGGAGGSRGMVGSFPTNMAGSRFAQNQNQYAIGAEHVIHISMSEGIDNNYPFGNSLMESIFKVFKQKELLEDSIIIYRVQRAPERRVFYIDVGNLPSHLAMSFVERVKNEVNQRRIPSVTGGGQSVVDAGYNPLCLDLNTRIPLLDGRTLALSELITEFESGKENWAYSCNPETGEIVPGVINWAGVTRKNTKVIKLTFDNGQELICTPDHKIVSRLNGFIAAGDLNVGDSIMPLYRKTVNDSELVLNNSTGEWEPTNRTVGEFFRKIKKHQEFTFLPENTGKVKTVILHRDFDSANNDPRNLWFMNEEDHAEWNDYCSTLGNKMMSKTRSNVAESANSVELFNHKIIKIEEVENRDTGTITIDGTERWHNYHTFAIESGIFVKNSINEDYFFPQSSDGRGSKVEILPGGTNLGEIDDLKYFTNKLFRALRIPSSYLPTGSDDGGSNFNDGRVGTAYIQELRFNKYCERLQSLITVPFDNEFKLYLHNQGINVDYNLFDLAFNPPQNFAAYRQAEMDTARVNTFNSMVAVPFMSKRFAMKRFLGMTAEEIAENESMWREENVDTGSNLTASAELRGAGITANNMASDMSGLSRPEIPPELTEPGAENAPGAGATSGSESGGGEGAAPPQPAG